MRAYYNEINPFAAEWLRELIKDGLITDGDVDCRSIEDVIPSDLKTYTQCHFFAGIGVWSYALRQAGWPDDRPVWTGSCPCQPFSAAGKGNGFADERHLWPSFHWLIEQCRPVTVFGEQVASKDGLAWLDLVSADMEGAGYTIGAIDSCAAGFGAPHIRQRLYWVANAGGAGLEGRDQGAVGTQCPTIERSSCAGRVANANSDGCSTRKRNDTATRHGDTAAAKSLDDRHRSARPTNGFWRDVDWLLCRDGKWRPTQPEIQPLAHGATNRVGILRGAGNAIVAPQAIEIIKTYLEGDICGNVEM